MEKLNEIKAYWNLRAEGYAKCNTAELAGGEKQQWARKLRKYLPDKEELKILDMGCGPGFFSIVLSEMGHHLTAFDYTENMLGKARENARRAGVSIEFVQGDAQNIPFREGVFDAVVSRNLTWNLEEPEKAYKEWLRILKIGGCFINFDANHYLYMFDEDYNKVREQDKTGEAHHEKYLVGVDTTIINEIAYELPLSKVVRPVWDVEVLLGHGVNRIEVNAERQNVKNASGEEKSIIKSFEICAWK